PAMRGGGAGDGSPSMPTRPAYPPSSGTASQTVRFAVGKPSVLPRSRPTQTTPSMVVARLGAVRGSATRRTLMLRVSTDRAWRSQHRTGQPVPHVETHAPRASRRSETRQRWNGSGYKHAAARGADPRSTDKDHVDY